MSAPSLSPTSSIKPSTRVSTTGTPSNMASAAAMPKGSRKEGMTTSSADWMSGKS